MYTQNRSIRSLYRTESNEIFLADMPQAVWNEFATFRRVSFRVHHQALTEAEGICEAWPYIHGWSTEKISPWPYEFWAYVTETSMQRHLRRVCFSSVQDKKTIDPTLSHKGIKSNDFSMAQWTDSNLTCSWIEGRNGRYASVGIKAPPFAEKILLDNSTV
jgi:hypothetical protein